MDHIRIDDGIKRGPRHKHKLPVKPKDHKVGIIPPDLNPDTVLERYLTESTTSQIAQEYGVSRKTLVRWLVEQRPAQWKQIQIIRALCRKEDGDEGIETACDALSLARAREQLRSGQFDLERLDAPTWGQQVRTDVNVNIDLGSALQRIIERKVERLVEPEPILTVSSTPQDKGDGA